MRFPTRTFARFVSGISYLAAISLVLYLAVLIARREASEIGGQLRMLKDGEPHERGGAAWQLVQSDSGEMNRIAPALIRAIEDEDGYVRSCAAGALGELKPVAPWDQRSAEALTSALNDPDHRVRADAARSLGKLDVILEITVPALMAAAGIGESTDPVLSDNKETRPDEKPDAISPEWEKEAKRTALGTLGAYAKRGSPLAISSMLAQVDTRDPALRQFAISSLGPAASHDEEMLNVLLKLSRSQDLETREAAIEAIVVAIRTGGSQSRRAFDVLLNSAESAQLSPLSRFRVASAGASRYFWEVVPILDQAFRSKELENQAAQAIDDLVANEAIPKNFKPITEVNSRQGVIRYLAVRLLKPRSDEELAALLVAVHDQHPRIKQRAQWAIMLGHSPESIDPALKAIGAATADAETRKALIPLLADGAVSGNRSAMRGLCQLVEDPDPGVRFSAIMGLFRRRQGKLFDFKEIERPFYRAFRDESPAIRSFAFSMLDAMVNEKVVPRDFEASAAIKSEEPGERLIAVLMSDPQEPEGIEVLIRATRDPDSRIRIRAVNALRKVGAANPQSDAVLQALTAVCQDPEDDIRQVASQAKSALEAAIKSQSGR